ncbi:MAG: hypothetical protein HYX84_08045 [Chloroflexi bacterium]|nr:hypothetical protein [Chloroflexota bacterium]
MSSFEKALLWTAIPSSIVSIGLIIASIQGGGFNAAQFKLAMALVGIWLFLVPTAGIAAIILSSRGQTRVAAGILAGVGIGLAVSFASCFVIIAVD